MPRISFTQKEISGNPVAGAEFDRYLLQTDTNVMNGNELLSFDPVANEVFEIAGGAVDQFLTVMAGVPAFAALDKSKNMAQSGHVAMRNGLILNYTTVSALAALATSAIVHDAPFTTINLGSFVSVVDINNVQVQAVAETLAGVSIKNFDAVNAAATVRVFSLGI